MPMATRGVPTGVLMSSNYQEQFLKTALCVYHRRGHCVWGSACLHAHGKAELREAPNLFKTSLCAEYRAGACSAGRNCRFAHGPEELRSTAALHKTRRCPRGRTCAERPFCRYAHDASELRARPRSGTGRAAEQSTRTSSSTTESAAAAAKRVLEGSARARERAVRWEMRGAASGPQPEEGQAQEDPEERKFAGNDDRGTQLQAMAQAQAEPPAYTAQYMPPLPLSPNADDDRGTQHQAMVQAHAEPLAYTVQHMPPLPRFLYDTTAPPAAGAYMPAPQPAVLQAHDGPQVYVAQHSPLFPSAFPNAFPNAFPTVATAPPPTGVYPPLACAYVVPVEYVAMPPNGAAQMIWVPQ